MLLTKDGEKLSVNRPSLTNRSKQIFKTERSADISYTASCRNDVIAPHIISKTNVLPYTDIFIQYLPHRITNDDVFSHLHYV